MDRIQEAIKKPTANTCSLAVSAFLVGFEIDFTSHKHFSLIIPISQFQTPSFLHLHYAAGQVRGSDSMRHYFK